MGFKEKLIGFLLIVLGAWPFALKVPSVSEFFSSYPFLEMLTPGEIVYQIIIILLGILLIWTIKPRLETAQ